MKSFLIIAASCVGLLTLLIASRITHPRFSIDPSESSEVQSESESADSKTHRGPKRLTARNAKLPPGIQAMTAKDSETLQLLREDRLQDAFDLFMEDEPGTPPSGAAPILTVAESLRRSAGERISDPNKRKVIDEFVSKYEDQNAPQMGQDLRRYLIEQFGREWWQEEGIMVGWDGGRALSYSASLRDSPLTHGEKLGLANVAEDFRLSHGHKLTVSEVAQLPELREKLESILGNKTDRLYEWDHFTGMLGMFPSKMELPKPIRSLRDLDIQPAPLSVPGKVRRL